MSFIADLSIRRKLMLMIVFSSTAALLLACLAFVMIDTASTRQAMIRKLQIMADIVGRNAISALEFSDKDAALETLQGLQAEPHIMAAAIYDAKDSVFAHHQQDLKSAMPPLCEPAGYRFGNSFELFHDVVFQDQRIGAVYIQSDLEELETRQQAYIMSALGLLLISGAAALIVGFVLQRWITAPILDLAKTTLAVSEKRDYSLQAPEHGCDEIGTLVTGFNDMLTQIQARDATLRQNEARYRLLTESSPDLIILGTLSENQKIRIQYINPAGIALLGAQTPEQITRQFPIRFIHPDYQARGDERAARMQKGEKALSEEMKFVRLDNKVVDVELVSVPLADTSPQQVLMLARDITERNRAEADRQKAESELKEQRARSLQADRLRSLGEMAAGIAHELNQPLVGVRGLAEHIVIGQERGWDLTPEKLKDRMTRIIEQADRMVHIIQHVRMFAREAGKSETEPVNINDVVTSSLSMVSAQFRSRGITLNTQLANTVPPIEANPYSLEEVLLNLLNNARDAVEERQGQEMGFEGRVVIATARQQDHLIIEVTDNGPGVPPESQDRIFDSFFTTKDPDKGTGLGLSICKTIVEDLNGTLSMRSTPGQNTTMTIKFSTAPQQLPGLKEEAT